MRLDEIELLLESVNQYKCKCEYEGINCGSVRSKSYPAAGFLLTTFLAITSYRKNEVHLKVDKCINHMN